MVFWLGEARCGETSLWLWEGRNPNIVKWEEHTGVGGASERGRSIFASSSPTQSLLFVAVTTTSGWRRSKEAFSQKSRPGLSCHFSHVDRIHTHTHTDTQSGEFPPDGHVLKDKAAGTVSERESMRRPRLRDNMKATRSVCVCVCDNITCAD